MKKLILTAVPLLFVFGCDSNPTNEPSADDINAAVERKMKAIDDDPTLTPEGKAEMKKHIAGPAKGGPTSR